MEARYQETLQSALEKVRGNEAAMLVLKNFQGDSPDLDNDGTLCAKFILVMKCFPSSEINDEIKNDQKTLKAIGLNEKERAAILIHAFETHQPEWGFSDMIIRLKIKHFGEVRERVEAASVS